MDKKAMLDRGQLVAERLVHLWLANRFRAAVVDAANLPPIRRVR